MSSDSSGEDNVVNTTILELFALVIFLFIIALAAIYYKGEEEVVAYVEDIQEEKHPPNPDDNFPIENNGELVFMPIFEGLPACIVKPTNLEYLTVKEFGRSFKFSDYITPYTYILDLYDIKGEPLNKWEVQYRNFISNLDGFISLLQAHCSWRPPESLISAF